MNAAIRAVAKVAAARDTPVWGIINGFDGLIDGRFRPLTRRAGKGAALSPMPDVEYAGGLGGTVLGTARSPRFMTREGRSQAAATYEEYSLEGLIVIGGNGTMEGAHHLYLEHGVRVVGIPASIDNDIGLTRESIGVDTALNTIVEACDRISDTAASHHRAFIVEVMGLLGLPGDGRRRNHRRRRRPAPRARAGPHWIVKPWSTSSTRASMPPGRSGGC